MNSMACGFRHYLQTRDILFIQSCLCQSESESDGLLQLLIDPETVDSILDHPKLLQTVLESVQQLTLSPRLYFYLLTRHSLKQSGINEPDLADYISGVLNFYLHHESEKPTQTSIFYVIDWLNQLEQSAPKNQFHLYVSAGNYLLFLTGIFPGYIERRTHRHGAPNLPFYEDVARQSYRYAAEHPASQKTETNLIYHSLAERFSELRYALNDTSERLMHLSHNSSGQHYLDGP